MMKLNANTDSYEQIDDVDTKLPTELTIEKTEQADTATVLAEGLSTATSLAQVREAAKAVLNETEGTE